MFQAQLIYPVDARFGHDVPLQSTPVLDQSRRWNLMTLLGWRATERPS